MSMCKVMPGWMRKQKVMGMIPGRGLSEGGIKAPSLVFLSVI